MNNNLDNKQNQFKIYNRALKSPKSNFKRNKIEFKIIVYVYKFFIFRKLRENDIKKKKEEEWINN